MKILRRIIVFDAADLAAESGFWAGLLGGTVHPDDAWHSIVVDGEWVMGVQLVPDHEPPVWPSGPQRQQVHLDLHVDDLPAALEQAVQHGARQLQEPRRPDDNPDGTELYAVLASPAGHPFCLGTH